MSNKKDSVVDLNHTGTLLSSTNRIEVPFVKVTIGGYTFGIYKGKTGGNKSNGVYAGIEDSFPNYVKSLEVKKTNTSINNYKLEISYPVTNNSDPNFFEKILGSESSTRKITIAYGDATQPNFAYNLEREESATITNVETHLDLHNSVINYTISAVSAVKSSLTDCKTFPGVKGKPSMVIKSLVRDNANYHLLDVFTGMNVNKLDDYIAGDDAIVAIPTMTRVSTLEYISKLVEYMNPKYDPAERVVNSAYYQLSTFDDENGSYFRVIKIDSGRDHNSLDNLSTYSIDIGYPTANIITDFNINTTNNWSLYYEYKMSENANYINVIGDDGSVTQEYSPILAKSDDNELRADVKTWWTKATSFPITATLKLKGLLRPTILMSYVKVNVWFYGNKHISSGYYIITSHVDSVSESGYFTTLGLQRVSGENL